MTSYGAEISVEVEPGLEIAPASVEKLEFHCAVAQRGTTGGALQRERERERSTKGLRVEGDLLGGGVVVVVEAARRSKRLKDFDREELTASQSEGENSMVGTICDDQISQSIDVQSQWIGQRCCDDGEPICRSRNPFLYAHVARVQNVHETQRIEGDRRRTTELIRPRARVAR